VPASGDRVGVTAVPSDWVTLLHRLGWCHCNPPPRPPLRGGLPALAGRFLPRSHDHLVALYLLVFRSAREFMPFQSKMQMSMSQTRRIELEEAEDGDGWVSRDLETGVASQGETKEEALRNLDEAVELYHDDSDYDPEEEREFLEEIGLDPEEIEAARERNDELPEFMQ